MTSFKSLLLRKIDDAASPWDDDPSNNHGFLDYEETRKFITQLAEVVEKCESALTSMKQSLEENGVRVCTFENEALSGLAAFKKELQK